MKIQKKKWHTDSESIRYDRERQEHQILRNISIIICGHQNAFDPNKPGYYRYILIDEKSSNYVVVNPSPIKSFFTPNRAIIEGLMMQ